MCLILCILCLEYYRALLHLLYWWPAVSRCSDGGHSRMHVATGVQRPGELLCCLGCSYGTRAELESDLFKQSEKRNRALAVWSDYFTSKANISCPSKQHSWFFERVFRAVNLPLSIYVSTGSQYLDSLDQLYVQATCLNPVLIDKTKEWARVSKRLFLTSNWRGTKTLMSTEDMELESNTKFSNSSKWCNIKTVDRAVEKAVRSYGQVWWFVLCCLEVRISFLNSGFRACVTVMILNLNSLMFRPFVVACSHHRITCIDNWFMLIQSFFM